MIKREQIQECVSTIQKSDLDWEDCNTRPSRILKPIDISPKQLKNAEKKYLSGCPRDNIVLMIDTTLFGGGKEGYVFSTDAFYCNELAALKKEMAYPLKYSNLKSVRKGKRDGHLILVLKDGTQKDVFFTTYANFFCVALNRIIELENSNEQTLNVEMGTEDEQIRREKITELVRILRRLAEKKYWNSDAEPECNISQEDCESYLQYMTLASIPEKQ